MQLRAGDRLEPCPSLPDIGALEHVTEYPLDIIFWRRDNESVARHRNPLFSRELGVTPSRSLVVELLHAVFLGVLLIWCRVAVWALIVGGVYGHSGGGGENIIAVMLVLRSRLMQFYPQHERLNQEVLTRVADLTPSMLGSVNNPTLKTKGAETWGLALFLIAELRTHHARLPNAEGNRLLHAGQSIEQVVRAWKGSGWVMPLQQQKDSFDESEEKK